MTNKDKFMDYAIKRLREKAARARRQNGEVTITQIEGFERCGRGKWKVGQR